MPLQLARTLDPLCEPVIRLLKNNHAVFDHASFILTRLLDPTYFRQGGDLSVEVSVVLYSIAIFADAHTT